MIVTRTANGNVTRSSGSFYANRAGTAEVRIFGTLAEALDYINGVN